MRRFTLLAIFVVGLGALAIAAVPRLMSADFVKERIAHQLSDLTGRTVTLAGEPTLSIYPHLAITIGNVTIANPPGMGGDAFVEGDSLTATLRLMPLILGRTRVDAFELDKPRIHLVVNADGQPNWHLPRDATPKDAGTPAAAAALGHLKVTDGTVVYDDLVSAHHEELTKVDLDVIWPDATGALTAAGRLQWRGEAMEFNGLLSDPIGLTAGKPSPLRAAIASKPVRVSFNGTVASLDRAQLDGQATVTTPALRRAIEWLGPPMGNGSTLGAASIKGAVKWLGPTVSFTNATVELDGNSAEGALSADFAGPLPKIQGTLAAKKLDLSPYIEALRADIKSDGQWLIAPVSLPIVNMLEADLRLSTDQMLIGAVRLDDAAVTATVDQDRITVDVGEARFYGGTLEAQITGGITDQFLWSRAEAQVHDVSARPALTDLATIGAIDGSATASVALGGQGQTWAEFAQNVAGSIKFTLADGSLQGVDLNALAAAAADAPYEPVSPGYGVMPFSRMAGTIAVNGGTFQTDNLTVSGKGFDVALSGWGSLVSGLVEAKSSLAMATSADKVQDIPVAITGTWRRPQFEIDAARVPAD